MCVRISLGVFGFLDLVGCFNDLLSLCRHPTVRKLSEDGGNVDKIAISIPDSVLISQSALW